MATSRDGTLVEVGTLAFSRTFPPITRHLLALYCGASGDSNPIHVDSDFAKRAGFDDVFAHGMLVMAFLGATLEDAGAADAMRAFSGRFVSITQLGAEITCEARIADVNDAIIELELLAKDQAGDAKIRGQASIDRTTLGETFWASLLER